MAGELIPAEALRMSEFGPTQEAMAVLDVARCRELLRPLNDDKRRFLRLRALTGSDAEASRLAGKAATAIKFWRRNDKQFRAAYDALLLEPIVHAMAEIQMLAPKAVGVVATQLDSAHGPTAQRAAEMVLRSKGVGILSNLNVEIEDKGGNAFMEILTRALEARNKTRTAQAAADLGDVVDAEVTRVE